MFLDGGRNPEYPDAGGEHAGIGTRKPPAVRQHY